MLRSPLASSTGPAFFAEPSIFGGVLMALQAMSFLLIRVTFAISHVSDILHPSPEEKMLRIQATRDVATVSDIQPFRDFSDEHDISENVSADCLALIPSLPVAHPTFEAFGPKDAAVSPRLGSVR